MTIGNQVFRAAVMPSILLRVNSATYPLGQHPRIVKYAGRNSGDHAARSGNLQHRPVRLVVSIAGRRHLKLIDQTAGSHGCIAARSFGWVRDKSLIAAHFAKEYRTRRSIELGLNHARGIKVETVRDRVRHDTSIFTGDTGRIVGAGVNCGILDIGIDYTGPPQPAEPIAVPVQNPRRHRLIVVLHVLKECQAKLLFVARATRLPRLLTRLGKRWEKQGREDRDDGNDNEQFD